MKPTKIVPVVRDGYCKAFFSLDLESSDLASQPHLMLNGYSRALFALQMGDRGLQSIGIGVGDYLLFGTSAPLRSSGQISLVRQEDEFIIRETYWSGDTTILRVPGETYPTLIVPTENVRIAAVLDDVIRNDELAPVVRFG